MFASVHAHAATTSCNNRGPYTPSCAAGPRRLKIRPSIFAKKISNLEPASSKQMQADASRCMCKCRTMQE